MHSPNIGYTVVERFDPSWPAWSGYIKWSKLDHLQEVVSLDDSLCPTAIRHCEPGQPWWPDELFAGSQFGVFRTVELALNRLKVPWDPGRMQVLALERNPSAQDIANLRRPDLVLLGFDLVEDGTGRCMSALTNCGGFDRAFLGSELSPQGLLTDLARAYEIGCALRANYPTEDHADCVVWAIWRMRGMASQ